MQRLYPAGRVSDHRVDGFRRPIVAQHRPPCRRLRHSRGAAGCKRTPPGGVQCRRKVRIGEVQMRLGTDLVDASIDRVLLPWPRFDERLAPSRCPELLFDDACGHSGRTQPLPKALLERRAPIQCTNTTRGRGRHRLRAASAVLPEVHWSRDLAELAELPHLGLRGLFAGSCRAAHDLLDITAVERLRDAIAVRVDPPLLMHPVVRSPATLIDVMVPVADVLQVDLLPSIDDVPSMAAQQRRSFALVACNEGLVLL
eukprot:CAMPEP_0115374962 /NCGR_PEP_ID=MMETSP0271-20121206/2217_1 /TAXON_ID=71861 /ORGANISM="Scrippsiella trochoidea, Strain CCMP3099" /LENGTH=255 /DNA_ID=CAMNT_0002798011 /DNA_START=147 /DNA_END=910 /DNA_ORIENTATION=+